MNKHVRRAAIIILILLVILIFIYSFSLLSQEKLTQISETLGIWGPLVLLLYIVISQVVAPISGFPGWLAAFALYGIWAFAILYTANMISGAIGFLISQKLGRKWVGKLGGQKMLDHIDELLLHKEREMLIYGRLIGFALYDIVSYAAGFTKISFKDYLWISAVFTAIPHICLAILFYYIPLTTNSMMTLSFVVAIGTSIVAIVLHRMLLNKRSPRNL